MRARRRRAIRPAVAIQVLLVLFGLVIAAFFPFLSLFLDGKGLTAGQIGIVIAVMAMARLILSPLWGHLADTTIGRRRALQIGTLGGRSRLCSCSRCRAIRRSSSQQRSSRASPRRSGRTSTRSRSKSSATSG